MTQRLETRSTALLHHGRRLRLPTREWWHGLRTTPKQRFVRLHGRAEDGAGELSIALFGTADRSSRYFLASEVFSSLTHEEDLDRKWFWEVRRSHALRDADFLVVEALLDSRFLAARLFGIRPSTAFFCPLFLEHRIDASTKKTYLRTSSLKNDVRQVGKAGFTASVSQEPADLRVFMDEFVRPHLMRSHGFRGIALTLEGLSDEEIAKRLRAVGLLQVTDPSGEWVAGAILDRRRMADDSWLGKIKDVGVRQGDPELVRAGALKAAWHLSVEQFRDLGIAAVSLGFTPPFLRNGVLRYKKKYRPHVRNPSERGAWIVPNPKSEQAVRILGGNPFVQIGTDGTLITIRVREEGSPEATQLDEFRRTNHLDGIDEYAEVVLKPGAQEPRRWCMNPLARARS